MEVLAVILGSALTEAGRSLCGFFPSIKNFISFQSNLSALEKEKKSLADLKNKVIEEVDYSSDAQMTLWLREVEQIMLEVNSAPTGMPASNQKLCGCFFNCSERYRVSKEIARMLKEIERLLKAGDIAVKLVGRNYLAKAVEHIPGPSIVNQTTASKHLAKVMDLLHDDDVLRIGVWGMGGVGKTTLVQNLNNELKYSSSTSKQHFSMVIWATVSKEMDLKKVQIQLTERLNMEVTMEESVKRLAIKLHQRLQKEKFLLILDDVWEPIDLDSLGVPRPEVHSGPEVPSGSKIILTSRSLEVCREMKTDIEVKVDVLNDEESWQLFKQHSGSVSTLEHIEPLARAVAKECSGLPLAITIVGAAMRGKIMIELWKDALNELRRSVPFIRGIENNVFRPLKWSYDSLQGKNIKPCFLYCCLYPEDFSIEVKELVNCWLGEGLIDERQKYEDSYNRGMAIVENLKDSCLLEHGAYKGTVKMHDVVRDVSIWISSSLEDGYKSLVQSGIGLTQISEVEISQSLKRISFMHNKITELSNCENCCPVTMSLLLQGNLYLERIPDEFLQAFQSLKVLNLSETSVRSLPKSILQLDDLRVLLLRKCINLGELPQLGMLSKLQVLDCRETDITELPNGMRTLLKLRQLYLSRTHNLTTIKAGIISGLSSLEVLDMTHSAYIWSVNQKTEEAQTTFRELLSLNHLLLLNIQLKDIPTLGSRDLTWLGRLTRFQFFIGPNLTDFMLIEVDGKRVKISGLYVSRIYVSKLDLLPDIEELHLHNVAHLESVSELIDILGLSLSRLRMIKNFRCPQLKYLLWPGNPRLNTEMLQVVKVSYCDKLEQLFLYSPETEAQVSVVLNLRIIKVKYCNALKKVPLRSLNPDTIEEIRGDQLWWTNLEQGSEENTKVHLQSFFKPLKTANAKNFRSLTGINPYELGHSGSLPLTHQNANTIKRIRGEAIRWQNLEWDNRT